MTASVLALPLSEEARVRAEIRSLCGLAAVDRPDELVAVFARAAAARAEVAVLEAKADALRLRSVAIAELAAQDLPLAEFLRALDALPMP